MKGDERTTVWMNRQEKKIGWDTSWNFPKDRVGYELPMKWQLVLTDA